MCTAKPASWTCAAGCATPKTATWKWWPSGNVADLAELRASLRRGPRGSRVDHVIEHYLDEQRSRRAELVPDRRGLVRTADQDQ